MKKKIKKEDKKEMVYTAGEVGMLLESINDGIQVLAEDQMDIKKNIKEMKDDISVLKSDVSVLKKDVSVLKSDVSVLKKDVSVLKSDVSDMKFELKRKVSYDEFEKLEKRVIRLEKFSLAR